MRIIKQHGYGTSHALTLEDAATPTAVRDQVLVRVHATAINFPDWARLCGKPFIFRLMSGGLIKPDVETSGADIAGVVVDVGPEVTEFHPGDEVLGDISWCGWGGFAEYVVAPQAALVIKPASISFVESAAVPMSGVVALQGLRDQGHVQAGQEVLIVGASSGNGTFLVQIAKALGVKVTGVCGPSNLDLVRSLGADRVIDYTREDFCDSGPWDLIVANSGYRPLRDYQRSLTPQGTYVVTGGDMKQVFEPMLLGPFIRKEPGQRMVNLSHRTDQNDIKIVAEMIAEGKVRPVVDRCFPLSETGHALAYYGLGHARGKVVVTVRKGQ